MSLASIDGSKLNSSTCSIVSATLYASMPTDPKIAPKASYQIFSDSVTGWVKIADNQKNNLPFRLGRYRSDRFLRW